MYPGAEVRAALAAAAADGVDLSRHASPIARLERLGYLPRDRARVDALVDRITRDAQVRLAVRERERGSVQLELPWNGKLPPLEPEQIRLF